MKYLILFMIALCFISCEEGDDTRLITGDYTLISYEKINCEGKASDLRWTGSKSAGEEISITGTLDISFLGTFKQELVIESSLFDFDLEVKFIGACTHVEGEYWRAGFSDSPFDDEDCEEADIIVEGNTLRWVFIDDNGCEVVMLWTKE